MIRYKLTRVYYCNTTDQYLTTRVIRVLDNVVILRTKLEDKRDDFNFHIVNFPFKCSNIQAAPPYEKYLSVDPIFQSICSLSWFFWESVASNKEASNPSVPNVEHMSSLRTLHCRHYNLVNRYRISVSQMTTDMFHVT